MDLRYTVYAIQRYLKGKSLVIVVFVLIIIGIWGSCSSENSSTKGVQTTTQYITIDGWDNDANPPDLIQNINVWNDYNTRDKVVCQVSHGERVELITRSGNGVKIKTSSGCQGWVTYWFIKEYK